MPDGAVGNLLIKGDSTCAYYWNKHERTKDTIEGHWIRTGDKFSRDAEGYYWYAGRADDMLKVGDRPYWEACVRNSAMRRAVAARGSPNIAKTSQCLEPIASAPSDEPPKNSGG